MKKLFSVLLALLMMAGVIAVAPITASAAAPAGPSSTASWDFDNVDANGSGNYGGGSWSWVQSTKTLTLTNINFSTSDPLASKLPGGATLVLNGTNTITSTRTIGGGGSTHGIYVYGDLTITGNGSLNAAGGTATGNGFSCGIHVAQNGACTIISGATVTATGGTSTGYSYGLDAYNLIINDGIVTATGNTRALRFDYTVPNGYKYFVSTTTTPSTTELTGNGSTTVIGSTHKYAKITPPPSAPTITGPTSLTLAQGYAATSTNAYTFTGYPAPTVTKTSGDAEITWNNATKKLDIAAGLAAGTYAASLRATNGVSPDATLNFTLTVTAAVQPPKTIPGTNREANFINWILYIVFFGWLWMRV